MMSKIYINFHTSFDYFFDACDNIFHFEKTLMNFQDYLLKGESAMKKKVIINLELFATSYINSYFEITTK
jgi:hypothetical protein